MIRISLFFLTLILPIVSKADEIPYKVKTTILNYEDKNLVKEQNKLEIGVQIPVELQEKVYRFVNEKDGDKLNPYLEWELYVYAVFKNEESDEEIIIDGFYYQDYHTYSKNGLPYPKNSIGYDRNEYESLGSYIKDSVDYPFRIRFSPPEIGKWTYNVYVNSGRSRHFARMDSFTVIDADYTPVLSVGGNGRYFEQEGSSFLAMGCNLR